MVTVSGLIHHVRVGDWLMKIIKRRRLLWKVVFTCTYERVQFMVGFWGIYDVNASEASIL